MLHEGERLIKPVDISKQIPWEKLEGVLVVGLSKIGEENTFWMSTMTFNEMSLLVQQLQATMAYKLGPMKEG